MSEPIDTTSFFTGRLLREPLLQFFLMGSALFAVAHVVEQHQQSAEREIVIDHALVARLSKLYELQAGSLPSKERLDKLVDEYVREEILFREAVRLGLDQDDEIVRRRLTQKLDFLQRDLLAVADPTDDALRQFYSAHADRFQAPARATFSHVYFSPDGNDAGTALERAKNALSTLRGSTVERSPQTGDRFPLQYDFSDLNPSEAAKVFGNTPLVDALYSAPIQQWAGPFESGYGVHLVFVSKRNEATVPSFNTIREKVKQAYLDSARRDGNEQKFDEMRKAYSVNYAYQASAQ